MKRVLLIGFIIFFVQSSNAQLSKEETKKRTVQLAKFKLKKKIVRVEYGKVIMYFNQIDYLKKETSKDTVRITPKYMSDEIVAKLLKKGRAKILSRYNYSLIQSITHRLEQSGSMAFRIFEFENGDPFFHELEIIGIYGAIVFKKPDSSEIKEEENIVAVNEFAYPEEFPDYKDSLSIKISDYFPLIPRRYYVYRNYEGYGELDTNQCRQTILNGKTVFYFAECFDISGLISIGNTMFGSGIYFYENDSLYTIDADDEEDIIEANKQTSLLLPAIMKPGDTSAIPNGWHGKKIFTYLKRENLNLGDKTFNDCIKFKIIEQWPKTNYIEYIWLQKNVGLVKWMRGTERIEELVEHFDKPTLKKRNKNPLTKPAIKKYHSKNHYKNTSFYLSK